MSYTSYSSTPGGANPDHSNHYIDPSQAIHSAISTHQRSSMQLDRRIPHDDEIVRLRAQWYASYAAFSSGQMSSDEFGVEMSRLDDARRDYRQRVSDFNAREQAGLTKLGDRYKEFCGVSDEEAQARLREGARLLEIQRANEARSQSRALHLNRNRSGH